MAPPMSSSLLPPPTRRSVRSAFVSHLGSHPGDRSFLLVRERPVKTAACEHLALHGAFDPAATERLYQSLRDLTPSALPLVLDLRGVTALDETLLTRLLTLRRELSVRRAVSFQIADEGPVPALLCRLGLEEKFGLSAARLPLRRTAVPAAPSQLASRAERRNPQWVINENR